LAKVPGSSRIYKQTETFTRYYYPTFERISLNDDADRNKVGDIMEDSRRTLWLASRGDLTRMIPGDEPDDVSFEFYRHKEDDPRLFRYGAACLLSPSPGGAQLRASRWFMLMIFLALLISLAACGPLTNGQAGSKSSPGKGVTVRMGRATWDSGWFQAQIFKSLLEELGYTVEDPITLDIVAFYFFAAQGDIDFWVNGWFPAHDRYFDTKELALIDLA